MNKIHTDTILQDLFISIKFSNEPITVTLNRKDIKVGDYILFEEAKWYLVFEMKTGKTVLTKVIKVEPYKSNSDWITVEVVDN